MPRHPRLVVSVCILCVSLIRTTPAAASVVAQSGDASIAHDAATWTLTAGGASLTIAADPTHDFAIESLVSPTGRRWSVDKTADTFVRVGGRTLVFGYRGIGFEYQNASAGVRGNGLELNVTYVLPSLSLIATRHYAIVSGSPSFEAWTTFAPSGAAPTLADINAMLLTVPAGIVHWVTGLQGPGGDDPDDGSFTLEQKALAAGEHLNLGATYRASEHVVPWFSIDAASSRAAGSDGTGEQFYAALIWSGGWSLDLARAAENITITLGLAPMSTSVQTTVDGPHVVFGMVAGGAAQTSAALRSYLIDGLRGGRPLTPLVTYNTWYAYGTAIDETSMRTEMERASQLGAELFVIDAGWYPNTGVAGPGDFDAGLGGWSADPDRFPHGLAALRDYAHSLGMKFGLWVEPERVNLSLVGDNGVKEAWLATSGGEYGSDHAAQICLAGPAARQWLLDHLSNLIDDVQPDYLKWDNNMFINCDRGGHGHGAQDGNFAHLNALYSVLSILRERYPDLLIENVSGGGNRLDVGMLRFSDAGWMDDRTAPSAHVRHNLQGLSAVFPPAYLLSFVTDHITEPLRDAPDLSLYFRSRMAGALGLCFRADSFSDAEAAGVAREIAIYKTIRSTLSVAAANLLSPQAASDDPPAWDVLQEAAASDGGLLIGAFQSDEGVRSINVKPSGLDAGATYLVRSVDAGLLGAASGADLMANGIDVVQSPASAAHVLIITRQP